MTDYHRERETAGQSQGWIPKEGVGRLFGSQDKIAGALGQLGRLSVDLWPEARKGLKAENLLQDKSVSTERNCSGK